MTGSGRKVERTSSTSRLVESDDLEAAAAAVDASSSNQTKKQKESNRSSAKRNEKRNNQSTKKSAGKTGKDDDVRATTSNTLEKSNQKKASTRLSRSKKRILKYAGTSSLFILSDKNVVRRFLLSLVEWHPPYMPFDFMIMLTIVANLIVLALDSHLPNGDTTPLSQDLDTCEPYFLSIFATEAILKILAYGLVLHRGAYLRSPWNILDVIVLVPGLAALLFPTINQPALRSFRVLRPLKLITGVESLQVVLKCLIKAMVPLIQIGLIVTLSILLFAIIGVEFYSGVFHAACLNQQTGEFDLVENGMIYPCVLSNTTLLGGNICPPGYVCSQYWQGPYYGIACFDDIFLAMLTVFTVISLSGWTDVLYASDDALGRAFNWMFYVPLVIVGAFFMLNLVLGVLSGEFSNEKERGEKRRRFFKIRERMQTEQAFDNYVNWICRAEELVLSEERTTEHERAKILAARKHLAEMMKSKKKNVKEDKDAIMDETDDEVPVKTKQPKCSLCSRLCREQRALRYAVRRVVKNNVFYWMIIALVFLNTIFLSLEMYPKPPYLETFLYYEEYVFDTIFAVEMLLKLYGLGFSGYFRSSFNKFDATVVFLSFFELVWQWFDPLTSFGFSVLRACRLLRAFKVTRYWPSLRNLIMSLLNSVKSIFSLLFLIFLFIVIFSTLGMQLFGGKFNFPDGRPVHHFDTFSNALLTVFQIMSLEDWNQVMYCAIQSQGGLETRGAILFSLYFVILIIFGSYTLLNVFIAIAVDNLAEAQAMTAAELAREQQNKKLTRAETIQVSTETSDGTQTNAQSVDDNAPVKVVISSPTPCVSTTYQPVNKNAGSSQSADKKQGRSTTANTGSSSTTSQVDEDPTRLNSATVIELKPIVPFSSLFIFAPTNPVRKAIHVVVNNNVFEAIILLAILGSSIALAATDPINAYSVRNIALNYVDLAFLAIFSIELILKVIDLGLCLHVGSYLRDAWNILDALVVACGAISLIFMSNSQLSSNLSSVKTLRVFRVLRPLKTVNKLPKLKVIFDTVVDSFKNLLIIMIIYLLLQLIFAIVGVQLFEGTFYSCNDASKATEDVCQGEFIDYSQTPPTTTQREWTLSPLNYDNTAAALLTLFTVQTRSNWYGLMYQSMDSTVDGRGPQPNYNDNMSIFYIIYFLVFPFFFLNIFVALLVVSYKEQGNAELEGYDIDTNQKRCIDFVILARPLNCYMPSDKQSLRYRLWKLMMSDVFDYFISVAIVLNTVALMMKFYNMADFYALVLQYVNVGFTSIFALEALVKIVACGFLNYLRLPWNVFDFVTLIGSSIDALVTLGNLNIGINIGFLRLFRAARVIKILRRSYSTRTLLWTFGRAVQALPYVLMLIALLFFMYAVIGMQVFGDILPDPQTDINRHASFRSFPDALLLLFRSATFDSWVALMQGTMPGQACDPASYPNNTVPIPTCGSYASIPFFVSFSFLSGFLLLNLFVAVITDSFEYLTRDSSILGPHHLDEFIRVWAKYDPAASCRVHYSHLHEMLKELQPPLGFGSNCPHRLAYRKLIRMNMPLGGDGTVHFKTTIFALVREALAIKTGPVLEMDKLDHQLRRTIRKLWPSQSEKLLPLLVPYNTELRTFKLTIGKVYTCRLIARNWRSLSRSLQPDNAERRRSSLFARLVGTVKSSLSRRGSAVPVEQLLQPPEHEQQVPVSTASPIDRQVAIESNVPDAADSLAEVKVDIASNGSMPPDAGNRGDTISSGLQSDTAATDFYRQIVEKLRNEAVRTPSLSSQSIDKPRRVVRPMVSQRWIQPQTNEERQTQVPIYDPRADETRSDFTTSSAAAVEYDTDLPALPRRHHHHHHHHSQIPAAVVSRRQQLRRWHRLENDDDVINAVPDVRGLAPDNVTVRRVVPEDSGYVDERTWLVRQLQLREQAMNPTTIETEVVNPNKPPLTSQGHLLANAPLRYIDGKFARRDNDGNKWRWQPVTGSSNGRHREPGIQSRRRLPILPYTAKYHDQFDDSVMNVLHQNMYGDRHNYIENSRRHDSFETNDTPWLEMGAFPVSNDGRRQDVVYGVEFPTRSQMWLEYTNFPDMARAGQKDSHNVRSIVHWQNIGEVHLDQGQLPESVPEITPRASTNTGTVLYGDFEERRPQTVKIAYYSDESELDFPDEISV